MTRVKWDTCTCTIEFVQFEKCQVRQLASILENGVDDDGDSGVSGGTVSNSSPFQLQIPRELFTVLEQRSVTWAVVPRKSFWMDVLIGVIMAAGSLLVPRWSRAKCEDGKISNLLSFLFLSEHFQLLSWGSIRVRRDGEWVTFLGAVRKMSTEECRAEGIPKATLM